MEENRNYEEVGVLIVAGGSGRRMGGTLPKQFRMLAGEPLLARTIRNFARALPGAPIAVVLPEAYVPFWGNLAARFDLPRHTLVAGGTERFHSVRQGLATLPETVALIAVQDGVRPLTSDELIRNTVDCAERTGTAVPVVPVDDSLRRVYADGSEPADRTSLRRVQTPQVFRAAWLREAYQAAYDPRFTDDASVVERSGRSITLCEGERTNLKITSHDDLRIVEAILTLNDASEDEDGDEGI